MIETSLPGKDTAAEALPVIPLDKAPLLLVPVRFLDGDAARGDVGVELLELRHLLADPGLEGLRRRHVPEDDLNCALHGVLTSR